jgi:peptidoglycan/LPS O-acetylase OafA/YrhL
MFFYLCLWCSLLITRRFHLEISALMVIASFVFFGHLSSDRVLHTFFKNVQLLEFVSGILSYKLYASRVWRRVPPALATAAALGAFFGMATAESLRLEMNGFWLYGLPSTLLVLAMLNLEPLFQRNSPIVRLWAQMGDASYATYLSHYYVVELVRKFAWKKLQLIDPYTPLGVALIVLASLVLGNLIYKLIDRPLMRFFKAQAFEFRLPMRPT